MKKILVDHGCKLMLRKLFKCSYPTIRKALDGRSTSHLAYKIRTAALEQGGVLLDEVKENSN